MVDAIAEDANSPKEALDKLREKHEALEDRLTKLKRPRSVSPEEEREIQVIKKQKLAIKDKMNSIRNEI